MEIGRKIFYELSTGNVIFVREEMSGNVIESTIDQDFDSFSALAGYNRHAVNVIQLEYGQYAEDFATCSGYRVNPATKQLEFSYPEPGAPEPQPPAYRPPLSEQLEQTNARVADLELTLAELVSSK
ncbi:hypothetical protein [Paenibacillus thiaminolyticus]|uniref:hypothetical protein n=1 Tax=Paenibacillus thiaminolyticus TaxID=49283 RepID=UPI002543F350|nr:hypothetical protein [Paenibacillus thiaminolyticus]WII36906.1 hypothetical protein O0V01_25280 [Paenibacillus thiaminolyticus]